ncbi:unnamed protein product, partial [Ectocarpus fasciculatus]
PGLNTVSRLPTADQAPPQLGACSDRPAAGTPPPWPLGAGAYPPVIEIRVFPRPDATHPTYLSLRTIPSFVALTGGYDTHFPLTRLVKFLNWRTADTRCPGAALV